MGSTNDQMGKGNGWKCWHLHPVVLGLFIVSLALHNLASGFAGAGTSIILASSLHAPIEDIVVLVALTDEQVPEEFAEVRVVGFVVEAQSTTIVEEDSELVGEAATKEIGWGCHLLLHDAVVLLLLGRGLESLPGKSTAKEVHKDIGKGL